MPQVYLCIEQVFEKGSDPTEPEVKTKDRGMSGDVNRGRGRRKYREWWRGDDLGFRSRSGVDDPSETDKWG